MEYKRTRRFGFENPVKKEEVIKEEFEVTPEIKQNGLNLLYEMEGMDNTLELKIRDILKKSFRGYPDVHYEAVANDIKNSI